MFVGGSGAALHNFYTVLDSTSPPCVSMFVLASQCRQAVPTSRSVWLFATNKESTMTKTTATHRRFALTYVSTGRFYDPLSGLRRIRTTSSGRSNDEKWPVRGRVIR